MTSIEKKLTKLYKYAKENNIRLIGGIHDDEENIDHCYATHLSPEAYRSLMFTFLERFLDHYDYNEKLIRHLRREFNDFFRGLTKIKENA